MTRSDPTIPTVVPSRSTFSRIVPFIPMVVALVVALAVRYYANSGQAAGIPSHNPPHDPPAPRQHEAMIDIGSSAPDFTLQDAHLKGTDANGGRVSLHSLTQKGPVLFIYFLSYSCPRCVANLHLMTERKEQLDKLGVQIVAVCPNTVAELKDSLDMYSDFPFPILSDPDFKAADLYNLRYDNILFHGTFVIDSKNNVAFAMKSSHPYDNYDNLMAICKGVADNK